METQHTFYKSPLGIMKISGTEMYISEVSFIEDNNDMHYLDNDCYPLLHKCVEQLIEYFNGQRTEFDLPINQPGTEFQHNVWSELMELRIGRTISYMDLAKRLGDPKTIRAAASANGKNNVSIIIPCHRVVGSNQSLTGYAWGLWRKKWLLEHENKIANGVQTLF